jgi:hypothetical protein
MNVSSARTDVWVGAVRPVAFQQPAAAGMAHHACREPTRPGALLHTRSGSGFQLKISLPARRSCSIHLHHGALRGATKLSEDQD